MLNKLFKKHTIEDLLQTLQSDSFNEAKADSIAKDVDLAYLDNNNRSLLHIVAAKNLTEAIKWLMTKKLNINTKDMHGDTALMHSVKEGAIHSVRLLLHFNADANIVDNKGRLPIQEAAASKHLNMFQLLKQKTKNFSNVDKNGHTILYDAIDSQDLEIVEEACKLLDNEIDPRVLFYPKTYANVNILRFFARTLDLNTTDEWGRTPLFYLIKNGALNTDSFSYLLSKGANINHLDKDDNTLLMALVKQIIELDDMEKVTQEDKEDIANLIEMIPWLVEEEIDYNHCNKNGENPLMYATDKGHLTVVKRLLESDIDPNYINEHNETPLSYAAMKGKSNIDVVSILLDYGARPNIENSASKTVIERLVEAELYIKNDKKIKMKLRQEINKNGEYRAVLEEILLNGEVNLNMLNSEGNPFFFDCVVHKNIDLTKLLVKYGADINLKNKEGYNIIYFYMANNTTFRKVIDQQNYLIMLRNIISLGADVNSRDDFGGITLHKAILDNDIQTVKILLNASADVNAVDNKGRNMVHNCMWQNKLKVFRLIYSINKKLINQPDKFGVLPINYAAFLGYTDLVLELIDLGSFVNSPTKKAPYILNFLKKFHKNVKPLIENTRNPSDKKKIKLLIENMSKEFDIQF